MKEDHSEVGLESPVAADPEVKRLRGKGQGHERGKKTEADPMKEGQREADLATGNTEVEANL